jgi:hypothetical protein
LRELNYKAIVHKQDCLDSIYLYTFSGPNCFASDHFALVAKFTNANAKNKLLFKHHVFPQKLQHSEMWKIQARSDRPWRMGLELAQVMAVSRAAAVMGRRPRTAILRSFGVLGTNY